MIWGDTQDVLRERLVKAAIKVVVSLEDAATWLYLRTTKSAWAREQAMTRGYSLTEEEEQELETLWIEAEQNDDEG